MCSPISLIMSEDQVFLPSNDSWNHSHTFIAKIHNLPDGMIGDKYARIEVAPPEDNVFRNSKTNEKLVVNKKWKVYLDENRAPEWYSNDLANQEDRAREAAKKWFDNFPDNLVPEYRKIAGDYANISSGDNSILTARDCSTLTGGYNSILTGGNYSILIGGNYSTLNGGYGSTLISGDNSVFCAGENSSFTSEYCDGKRMRTVTFYVGENGIEPNKKYQITNGKICDE